MALVGFPEHPSDMYNAAAVLAEGASPASTARCTCPTTGCSTSSATSRPARRPATIEVNGDDASACHDLRGHLEPGPPASTEALAGAEVMVNLSASPYHAGKGTERERMLVQRARDNLSAILFCNMVGGQDELVFDGHSLALDQDGRVVARAPQFEEALTICTVDPGAVSGARLRDSRHRGPACAARAVGRPAGRAGWPRSASRRRPTDVGGPVAEPLAPEEEVYSALRTGLRDYTRRTASSAWCSASPAASTPRWWRWWPWTRWGRSG